MRVACCSLVLLLSVAVFAYPSVPKDGSSESSQEHSEEDPSNVLPIIEDAIEAYMDLVKIDFSAGSNADNILTSGDVLERARKILKRVSLIDGYTFYYRYQFTHCCNYVGNEFQAQRSALYASQTR